MTELLDTVKSWLQSRFPAHSTVSADAVMALTDIDDKEAMVVLDKILAGVGKKRAEKVTRYSETCSHCSESAIISNRYASGDFWGDWEHLCMKHAMEHGCNVTMTGSSLDDQWIIEVA